MQIYILDIFKCDKEKLLSFYDSSAIYRKKKIDCAKNADDRLRILGGSFLISYIANEFGIPCQTLSVTDSGKPFFKNSSFCFSLSHKENICVAAISDSSIGVDVEIKKKQKLNLAQRFFSEKEKLLLEKSYDKDLTFTETWTRKESFFKAAQPKDYTLSDLCTAENSLVYNGASFELLTFAENGFIFSCCKKGIIEKTEKFYISI